VSEDGSDMGTKDKNELEEKGRMIHVRMSETIHKKVRIRAAETDQTIQDWVYKAIKRELENQGPPKS
jgi:hypothetical protein